MNATDTLTLQQHCPSRTHNLTQSQQACQHPTQRPLQQRTPLHNTFNPAQTGGWLSTMQLHQQLPDHTVL